MEMIVPLASMLVLMYFLLIRPQKKLANKLEEESAATQSNQAIDDAGGEEIIIQSSNEKMSKLKKTVSKYFIPCVALFGGGFLAFWIVLKINIFGILVPTIGRVVVEVILYGISTLAVVSGSLGFVGVFYCGILYVVCAVLDGCTLTVTASHIYGHTTFGKKVDLPVDSISAVGSGWFYSVTVATSSGVIRFFGMDNRDEILNEISKLVIERQHKPQAPTQQEIPKSSADELKKYKDLLDGGAITQEEYAAKKKQLLGL